MSANSKRDPQPNAVAAKAYSIAQNDDPHLRSWEKVKGYHVQGADGDIGHIAAFLVDEQTFAIRYVIVQTSDWWLGHQVLISPLWFSEVQWSDSRVIVKHTRDEIQSAPTYSSTDKIERSREDNIHKHYGLHGYWQNEVSSRPQHNISINSK